MLYYSNTFGSESQLPVAAGAVALRVHLAVGHQGALDAAVLIILSNHDSKHTTTTTTKYNNNTTTNIDPGS